MTTSLPEPLQTLYDATIDPGGEPALLPALQALHGGDLQFPAVPEGRAWCIANFVTSLDGIVSFNLPKAETGNEVSGGSVIDHVVMGILRSLADAVIWGSKTYHAARRFAPTPAAVWRPGADLFAAQRAHLGKSGPPIAVILTASGTLDLGGAIFRDPAQAAIIATTSTGAFRLHDAVQSLPATEIWDCGDEVDPAIILARLATERQVGIALHEGGPAAFGAFLAAGVIDEVFLTRAPQFIGRDAGTPRPGLVEGVAFTPAIAPWARLITLKRGGDLLFERYAIRHG
jgi:riboflavin biosynthesis pyrimidine reductase